jgi:phosphatidylserine/phosphatidylglycerophosphate/cardiolipin synthase-like enzyme
MKRLTLLSLLLLALATGCDVKLGPMPPVEVYFSPKGGCTEAVVRELDAAKRTVFVQAYSFTSKEIAVALDNAKARGVVVHVILDKSNLKENTYSDADFVAHHGISVLVDSQHSIAHNKVMIIDSQVVITGSFNFTTQAEHSNAENLLVIHDPVLAERYLGNWHDHEAHSQPYTGRGEVAERPGSERPRRTKAR